MPAVPGGISVASIMSAPQVSGCARRAGRSAVRPQRCVPLCASAFTLAFVAPGIRPGYDPVKQQISVLAVGPGGAWLDVAFVLGGLLMIAGVLALRWTLFAGLGPVRQHVLAVLLSVAPLGMIVCGLFPIDNPTPLHLLGANLACTAPGRRLRHLRHPPARRPAIAPARHRAPGRGRADG